MCTTCHTAISPAGHPPSHAEATTAAVVVVVVAVVVVKPPAMVLQQSYELLAVPPVSSRASWTAGPPPLQVPLCYAPNSTKHSHKHTHTHTTSGLGCRQGTDTLAGDKHNTDVMVSVGNTFALEKIRDLAHDMAAEPLPAHGKKKRGTD
jgi:hypothetical protein